MHRPLRPILVPVLLILTLLPIQGALAEGWSANGQREPDTSFDTSAFMWSEPDTSPNPLVRKLFFHAYDTMTVAPVNPNLAALGSSHHSFPSMRWEAMLGVWKDCNADGYVGFGEHALLTYRHELLFDDSICQGSAHLQGGDVRELILLGAIDPCRYESEEVRERECGGIAAAPVGSTSYWLLKEAQVWGDAGAPVSLGKASCPVLPMPRGTTSSTGFLVRYADCATENLVTTTVNEADFDGSLGLRFEDPENPQESDSALNQPFPLTLFGNPTTGEPGLLEAREDSRPTFAIWDCSGGSTSVDDPMGSGEPLASVRTTDPSVAQDPTQASAWTALDHAYDGAAEDCDPKTNSTLAALHPAPLLDADATPVHMSARTRNDVIFRFIESRLGNRDPPDVRLEPYGHDHATSTIDPVAGLGLDGPAWIADEAFVTTPALASRNHLGEPNGRFYWTFYARVDPAELPAIGTTLPGGEASHVYGADHCATIGVGAPIQNGWACDPAVWWKDVGGEDARPRYARGEPLGAVPGDSYHLRDVDCHDGRVARDAPVYASLAPLSVDGTCAQDAASG